LAQQLRFKDEFSLLILLSRFVCLFVFPTHDTAALLTGDVSHVMATGCHVAIGDFSFFDVDDAVKQVGFAMLAAEVLAQDVSLAFA
jgi:hypothetical protein